MASPDIPARMAAVRLLHGVLIEHKMLSEAQAAVGGLQGPDAARAGRLAALTLRHMGRADALLRPHLDRAPALRVQNILRLALAELFEDGAASHGVVNAAVTLTKTSQKTAKQAGLVNALLRKIVDAGRDPWDALPAPSLPGWLRKSIAKSFTRPRLEAIEAAHLRGAPLDLTVKSDPAAWAEKLGASLLPTGSLRLANAQVTALEGFETGDWWVQDAAAATPVRTLGDITGLRVLDLCAAPGGKTMQLAAAGADVTALDLSMPRMGRVRENLTRTGLAAELVTADALIWEPDAPFDVVLLDAPCSATGTIRRHPDLPYLRKPNDIEALTKLQYQLIDRALGFVKPGGRLVYCTCSLLAVEGEHQVTAALKRHPGTTVQALDPVALGLPAQAACAQGLRLLPDLWGDMGGMDGFFIAVLHRPA